MSWSRWPRHLGQPAIHGSPARSARSTFSWRDRVALGHGQAHLVVEEGGDDELVEVLLAAAEVGALVGEGHGEVALAGLERGEALGRLRLGEG